MSSMTPKTRPAINVPGSEPRPPMMTIAKRRPMKIPPDAELTGWMRISAARQRGKGGRDGEADGLHPDGIDAHQPKGLGVLRDRRDRATDEACLEEGEQRRQRHERGDRGSDHGAARRTPSKRGRRRVAKPY